MIIRVLLDEDSGSKDLVVALTASPVEIGAQAALFDVARVVDLGLGGAGDRVVLARAGEEGRLLVTCNRGDFFKLTQEGLNVAGICFATRPHKSDYVVAHSIRNAAIAFQGRFAGLFIDLTHYEAYPHTFPVDNDEA